jgi:hypothetical protein
VDKREGGGTNRLKNSVKEEKAFRLSTAFAEEDNVDGLEEGSKT